MKKPARLAFAFALALALTPLPKLQAGAPAGKVPIPCRLSAPQAPEGAYAAAVQAVTLKSAAWTAARTGRKVRLPQGTRLLLLEPQAPNAPGAWTALTPQGRVLHLNAAARRLKAQAHPGAAFELLVTPR